MDEIEVLFHGTKFKKTADKILKDGFNELSYFAYNLNDAYFFGGKYVFEVAFVKSELPKYWQVRCENKIPSNRIIKVTKFKHISIYLNKNTQKAVFDNASQFCRREPYLFSEKNPNFLNGNSNYLKNDQISKNAKYNRYHNPLN